MKFIHVSDTHLGCKIPIEYENIREEDFLKAFRQVIDFAIKEKVDFIIHSGDFFDERFRISLDLLYKVSEELARLREYDIPFIAIKGNHDLKGTRGKAFDELVISGLIKEVKIDKPIEISNVFIQGFSEPKDFHGKELQQIYYFKFKKIKAKENYFNILLTHTVPDIFDIKIDDPRILPFEYYPNSFDFYALGHIHFPRAIQIENSIFSLPGSTERYNLSESEIKSKKGFIFYDKGKIKFVELKIRKIELIDIKINSLEDIKELINRIIKINRETLIKLNVLTKEELKKELEEEIIKLKENNYKILYEIFLESDTKILSKSMNFSFITFEDLLNKIILSEIKQYENKEEILDELNKLLNLYEDYGANRVRSYILSKIRKGFYQKSLLEW